MQESWKGVCVCFLCWVLPENQLLRPGTAYWNALRDLSEKGEVVCFLRAASKEQYFIISLSKPSLFYHIVSIYIFNAAVRRWQFLFSFRPQDKFCGITRESILINAWVWAQRAGKGPPSCSDSNGGCCKYCTEVIFVQLHLFHSLSS